MKIQPLRNMVLVCPTNGKSPRSTLHVIAPERVVCPFRVVAIGPEVRDIQVGQTVLANRLAGTQIGSELLIPESALVGTL